jgi:hypothetical protein
MQLDSVVGFTPNLRLHRLRCCPTIFRLWYGGWDTRLKGTGFLPHSASGARRVGPPSDLPKRWLAGAALNCRTVVSVATAEPGVAPDRRAIRWCDSLLFALSSVVPLAGR